ncbi:MAG TPA: DUF4178 domain-containing protein [Gemmataceae bacterium]|nr:DUF4178 domain-containing protein [Gemmataceae bacterium]
MSRQANCPACGGTVTFQVGTSLVAVCPYCNSVVARGDRGLEDLGKVADLAETGSPLDLWLKGRYQGVPFDLTGRVQFRHPAGGVWDEWYAHFADGRWGWLAEAGGRFYLTFQRPAPPDLPGYDALKLGQSINLGPDAPALSVAEKNRGTTAGAKGEIPYRLVPDEEVPFADLSGPGGTFGTLDYSESPPLAFVGREVTLDDLGFPATARQPRREERHFAALQLNCPQCGGPLALRAPDQSERLGCPNCGALLDVREGKLHLLKSLKPPKVQPVIPLGTAGEYGGVKWTVLGFMQRSVRLSGVNYYWEEYLLYEPRHGFRWLVRSDDHWNWVEPLPPGAVRAGETSAFYLDKEYRLFQRAKARVVFVVGEFYWKVQAGEEVRARDFVRPPEMLSEEVTKGDGGEGEINWSHGLYLTPDVVEKGFGVRGLPRPAGIGPNQPFPHTGVYRHAAWLLPAALLLALVVWAASPRRQVFEETFHLKPGARFVADKSVELRGGENVKITLTSKSYHSWVHVDGELGRAGAPGRETFSVTAGRGRSSAVYLSALPAGSYALHLDFRWETAQAEADAAVRVQQGVAHPLPFFLALLPLAAVPFVVGLYHFYFETRRWHDSNLSG